MTKVVKSIEVLMPIAVLTLLIAATALASGPDGNGDTVPPEVADHAGDWPLPNKDYENTRATVDSAISSKNVSDP